MALAPGTRLGAYEILSLLGQGGMGEVYRAKDTKLGRDIALKILPATFTNDPDRVSRFRREAQVLASLNHPHIAQIHGLEQADGTQFLVLELVDGESLDKPIARGPIPVDEALDIARQIAEALETAHEKGIVHRDLKPANIALTSDGTVKVLDFGLAKATEAASGTSLDVTNSPTITTPAMMTRLGVILGTAAYMSPEQAKGRPADKRSDVWAFGCVLFEMLTGKRAFDGEDATDVIAAVVRGEPGWSALPQGLPEYVRLLLRRCLEKDRVKRVSDISTARFLITEPVASASTAAAPSAPVPVKRQAVWQRAAPFVITAALVGVVSGAMAWIAKPASAPPPVARFSFMLREGQSFTGIGRHLTAMSPDGKMMAYVANQQVFVRELASLEARPIAGIAVSSFPAQNNVTTPAFSPDSESLVFYSPAEGALKRVAVTGGSGVTVCPADNPFGVSWDESGIIFGQGAKGVLRVSPNGGNPERLVTLSNDEFADGPQMLPGGQVLFTLAKGAAIDRWERAQVVVQSLKSGQRKTLVEGGSDARYLPTGHLVYARAGVLFAVSFDITRLETRGGSVPVVEGVRRSSAGTVVLQGNPLITGAAQFSTSRTGSLMYVPGPVSRASEGHDLAMVDRAGRVVERLNLPAGMYVHPRISPDGNRIAFGVDDGKEADAYVYALGGGTSMQRITFGGHNRFPIWTADGKRIAFQSDREGDRGIYWQPFDGGAAERLTKAEDGASHVPESWSPSGDHFLYTIAKDSRVTLWHFSIRDKKSTQFDDVSSTTTIGSAFSPDGRWVAYSADNTVYIQHFPPTDAKYQLPNAPGAHHPFWARDGKELFYEPGLSQLYVVPVHILSGVTFGKATPLQAGVFGSTNPAFARNRDIDSEGKRFITPVANSGSGSEPTAEIRVVLNWFEELKARVPSK
jgi:serine/threonine-protein kinase